MKSKGKFSISSDNENSPNLSKSLSSKFKTGPSPSPKLTEIEDACIIIDDPKPDLRQIKSKTKSNPKKQDSKNNSNIGNFFTKSSTDVVNEKLNASLSHLTLDTNKNNETNNNLR